MKKSLVKNSIFNTIYTVLNILFPLITSAYVARVILTEGVGKVAYAQSIVSYFILAAFLGIPSYGLREIARIKDDKERKSKLFSELVSLNFLSTTLAIILYILTITLVPSFHDEVSLYIACGSLIVLNYFNIDWLYQGEEEYVYIVCRSLLIKAISIICLFLFVKKQEDYILYAWILTCATGGNYIFNAIHSRKYVRICFTNLNLQQHVKPVMIFAGGVVLSNLYSNIDTIMLGIMMSDHSIGVYTYANKIIQLSISICISVTAAFSPRLSYFYANNKEQFNKLISKGIELLTFITIPMTTGIFMVAPDIVEFLYGSAFMASAKTVRVFCVLIIIKSFGDLLCYQLIACTGNEVQRIPAVMIANITNIFLNVLLIPLLEENGAAVASVVSEFIVNLYQFRVIRRIIHLRFDKKAIWHSIIGSGIMAGYITLIKAINLPLLTSMLFSVGGGVLLYFIMSLMLGNNVAFTFLDYGKKAFLRKKSK